MDPVSRDDHLLHWKTLIPEDTVLLIKCKGDRVFHDFACSFIRSPAFRRQYRQTWPLPVFEGKRVFVFNCSDYSYDAVEIFARFYSLGILYAPDNFINFETLRQLYLLPTRLRITSQRLPRAVLCRWKDMVDFSDMNEVLPLLCRPIEHLSSRRAVLRLPWWLLRFYREVSFEIDMDELRRSRKFRALRAQASFLADSIQYLLRNA